MLSNDIFKFNIHTVCLVCFNTLPHPNERGSEGEHAIPKNIGGFWKVYDVCEECKKHFGDNIDHLTLSNPHIINALDKINIDKKLSVHPLLKYKSYDKFDGKELTMFRKGNEYRIQTKENDNSLICPDIDAYKIGLPWAKKRLRGIFTEVEIEEEYSKLHTRYLELKNNESVYSEKLVLRLRKGVNTNITFDDSTFKSIAPLISKIAIIFLGYFLSFEDLKKISNYYSLRDHARHNKPLLDNDLIWHPIFKGNHSEKFHKILFRNFENAGLVEVTLLRYPSWTVILNYSEELKFKDENNKFIEEIGLVFDFENSKKRYCVYRYKDEDRDYQLEF